MERMCSLEIRNSGSRLPAEDSEGEECMERAVWELKRAFYSFRTSALLAILMLIVGAGILVASKGAGAIYADMVIFLVAMVLVGWLCTSIVHGSVKLVICSLVLITVGTMLQTIFKQEAINKNPEAYAGSNPAAGLQLQYLLALAAAVAAGMVYYKWKEISSDRLCKILMVAVPCILLITKLVGKSVGGVSNWISIGGFSFQPTELVKPVYILVAACLLGKSEKPSRDRIIIFYVYTLLLMGLLAIQGEFGTLLLILLMFLVYVFLFLPDRKQVAITFLAIAVCSVVVILLGKGLTALSASGSFWGTNRLASFYLNCYEKIAGRFTYWLHPESDALNKGYQLLKAKESIMLGGWLGTESITDLPVKTSDLVFPALIQRCGMIFALLIFFIFIYMWLEGSKVFARKSDRYHRIVGAGITYMIFYQALLIIGGSTGICPLTGITLPFISSGGTSLLVSSMMIGVLIVVSGNVKWSVSTNVETEGENDDKTEEPFFKKSTVLAKYFSGTGHSHDGDPGGKLGAGRWCFRQGGQREEQGGLKTICKGIHKGKHSR